MQKLKIFQNKTIQDIKNFLKFQKLKIYWKFQNLQISKQKILKLSNFKIKKKCII